MSALGLSHLFSAMAGVLLALGLTAAGMRRFEDALLYAGGAVGYGVMAVLYAGIGR